MALERLQKIIAASGSASRRKAEQLILEGRVTVNGATVTRLGTKADALTDHIKVNGKLLGRPSVPMAYAYYKPKGVITTLSDPEGRPCVGDVTRKLPGNVFHAGRLDTNTEGLLFLTNDGNLANRVMHPTFGCPRVYEVKVKGIPEARLLRRLEKGILLDGRKTAPCVLELIEEANNAWLKVVLYEGRSHQIKKMLQQVGHPVSKIKRVKIGPVGLKGLKPGQLRPLAAKELGQLLEACRASGDAAGKQPKRPRTGRKPERNQ